MSLEGTALVERADANEAFYGQKVPAAHLLTGIIPAPEAATAMYEIIEAVSVILLLGINFRLLDLHLFKKSFPF